MKDALQILNELADSRKAKRYPNVPTNYLLRSRYSDKTANDLTHCIVDYLTFSDHFATRLSSTGTYRADIGRYVQSQQRAGMPDILACIYGRMVAVEVKCGRDRLSKQQKETIQAMTQSGALVYVAQSFQGFYDWCETYVLPVPAPELTLFHQRHPIPYLATPDLDKPNSTKKKA